MRINVNCAAAVLFVVLVGAALEAHAVEPCFVIHGRAHLYSGDGQLRIWHIGTHHDFAPDDTSWNRVVNWIEADNTKAEKQSVIAPSLVYLFADFEICPTEPFKKGSVQHARVLSATHRRYVHIKY